MTSLSVWLKNSCVVNIHPNHEAASAPHLALPIEGVQGCVVATVAAIGRRPSSEGSEEVQNCLFVRSRQSIKTTDYGVGFRSAVARRVGITVARGGVMCFDCL